MVFAEDGVNIFDQFSRVRTLRHTRSAQYERVETQQRNSESTSFSVLGFMVDTPFLFHSMGVLAYPRAR